MHSQCELGFIATVLSIVELAVFGQRGKRLIHQIRHQ